MLVIAMDESAAIGRAKTALVFNQGEEARAVITAVVASVRDDTDADRIRFSGSVVFEPAAVQHVVKVILPIADRVTLSLGLPRRNYTLSVANLGAASASDLGVEVSGFSADLPVLLTLLSASLDMSIPSNLVSTGHVASPDGDLAAVKALPTKIGAAVADEAIQRFVYAATGRDRSLDLLAPAELQRIEQALDWARDKLSVICVADVAELTEAVFDDEAIALASLRSGFLAMSVATQGDMHPIGRTVAYLARGNDERFWSALERRLLAEDKDRADVLLQAWIAAHVGKRSYPSGFGVRLLQLVRSLPPAVRRLRTMMPLLSTRDCIVLSQFAGDADHDDVRSLYAAATRVEEPHLRACHPEESQLVLTGNDQPDSLLDAVLAAIEPLHLAKQIAIPIDSARATYTLGSSVATCYEEFSDVVASFYLHLLRHTGVVSGPVLPRSVAADALELLERAFSRNGGVKGAFAEARDGTRGGLRYVLDVIADWHRYEEQRKQVRRVLSEALDPLDWNRKVAFIQALLDRLAPHLPAEIRSQPPTRFARHWEEIVQAYAQSLGQVHLLLRTL